MNRGGVNCASTGVSVGRLAAAAGLIACSGFGGASDQLAPAMAEQEVLGAMPGLAPSDVGSERATSGSAAADWSCLGEPPAARPETTRTGNVRYAVPVRSMFGVPINNLVARVCEAADLACASPLSEVRGLTPDGLMEMEVPVGFAGFVEMEPEAHARAVFHMRQPVFQDTVDPQPALMIPTTGVAQLAGLLNLELIPELAMLFVAVVDCRGERAPGVTFGNSLGGREFYMVNGLPNVMANATDIQGQGGFVNVPLRLVEVSAEVEADGQLIGARTVLPRVGWIVGITVRPPALPIE